MNTIAEMQHLVGNLVKFAKQILYEVENLALLRHSPPWCPGDMQSRACQEQRSVLQSRTALAIDHAPEKRHRNPICVRWNERLQGPLNRLGNQRPDTLDQA